jgi:hypothetical protein
MSKVFGTRGDFCLWISKAGKVYDLLELIRSIPGQTEKERSRKANFTVVKLMTWECLRRIHEAGCNFPMTNCWARLDVWNCLVWFFES